MSNKNNDTSYVIGKRLIELAGSFGTNGSSSPVAANIKGLGFGYAPVAGVYAARPFPQVPGVTSSAGVVRSATGQYDVTFEDPYLDVNCIGVDLQVAAASANWAQPGPVTNAGVAATGPTVRFFTINSSGTAVDVAAGASSRVMFSVQFRDSTTGFNKP